MAKKFTNKSIDLDLEVPGLLGNEVKIFKPAKSINAEFADEIATLVKDYLDKQKELAVEDQDNIVPSIITQLKFVYHDMDEEWAVRECTKDTLLEMYNFMIKGLAGLKKGGKN